MYEFSCEHCDGTVKERRVSERLYRHKGNFVILEDVPIGVCEKCGAVAILMLLCCVRVANIGRGSVVTERTVEVPVADYTPV